MPTELTILHSAANHPQAPTLRQMIPAKAAIHFRALALTDPELSVVLTGNDHIRQLNAKWRNQDKATDVLSFPLHEPESAGQLPDTVFALGDIVISLEYAAGLVDTREHHRRVATQLDIDPDELDWSLADEVHFLLIHGLLHLVGYDHQEAAERRQMKSRERLLWKAAADIGPTRPTHGL